ncbi:transposase [Streptomyces mirabilis]|uniref:transposase n=1 Tax=Streptomyces mirabilis TaxID=68239 RepID=UPI0036C37437
MKHCPPEFKADAIAPYQSRPGATIRWAAADLGVNPETLRNWARAAGANRLRGRWAKAPADAAGGRERRPGSRTMAEVGRCMWEARACFGVRSALQVQCSGVSQGWATDHLGSVAGAIPRPLGALRRTASCEPVLSGR